MGKIHLTDNHDQLNLPRGREAVWLHSAKDRRPRAERCVTLPEFLDAPWESVKGADLLVVVGLVSRFCTPGNRVRLGQYLTDPWKGPERVSVDDRLFIVDPWRMWWHFGCAGIDFGGCSVSYTLETRWNGFVVGMRENPCVASELDRYGLGVIEARGAFKFEPINIHVEPMPEEVRERYATEKEVAFNEEATPAAIIKRLAAFASSVYPPRSVPSFRDMFRARHLEVRATDLGVDRFLVGQIMLRAELTNYAAERFAV